MKLIRGITLKKVLAIGGIFLFLFPLVALAQTNQSAPNDPCLIIGADWNKAIKLQFEIPNVTQEQNGSYYIKDLGCYIVGVYRYFAGVAGILTVVMVMYGGVRYVVSLGNQQKISQAKDTITSALVGLLLVLASYTILFFINPSLTSFNLDLGAAIPTISEDTIFCTSKDSIIENGGRDCGELGIREGGVETCIWPGACASQGNICAYVGTGNNGYICLDPQSACEDTTSTKATCKIIDQAMQAAGVEDKICSSKVKVLNSGTGNVTTIEKCVISTPLTCDFTFSARARVDCGFGEGATAAGSTPCALANGDPRYESSNSGSGEFASANQTRYYCTNDRGAALVDSICCAKIQEVNCAYPYPDVPEFMFDLPHTCDSTQAKLPGCILPDGTSVRKEGANYPDSCEQDKIDLGAYCCVDLELVYH